MMRRWDPSRCNIYLHFYAEFYHFIGNWRIKLWIREYDGGIDYFERMFAAYILTYNLPGVFLAGGKHSSLEVPYPFPPYKDQNIAIKKYNWGCFCLLQ